MRESESGARETHAESSRFVRGVKMRSNACTSVTKTL